MKKKYEWKGAGVSNKNIPPEIIVKQFNKIEKTLGSLTPENLVKAATPESSVLHKLFTWDDTKAAGLYRLQEARSIINNIEIIVISDGQERKIPVYESVKVNEERVYKHIDSFTFDDIEMIKARTSRELIYIRNKLSIYEHFHPVVGKLDEAIETLQSDN